MPAAIPCLPAPCVQAARGFDRRPHLNAGTPRSTAAPLARSGIAPAAISGYHHPHLEDWPLRQGEWIISGPKQQPTPEQVLELVLQSLDDDKGVDIVSIPLHGKSTMADYLVIVSGASSRHIASMAEHLEFKLKQAGLAILGKEGLAQADWVLLDTSDVIVHLFRPEVRDFYQLERMWSPAGPDEVVQVSADA